MNQYLQIVYYKFKFWIYRTNERKKDDFIPPDITYKKWIWYELKISSTILLNMFIQFAGITAELAIAKLNFCLGAGID